MMSTMNDADAVARFAELLKAELPAFASSISPDTRYVSIRGSLPVYAQVDADLINIPVPIARDDVIQGLAQEVIRRVRHLAIEAVNLEPTIKDREEAARREGVIEGHAIGMSRGRSEGRAQAVDSIGPWLADLPDDVLEQFPWEWRQAAQDARTARADADE